MPIYTVEVPEGWALTTLLVPKALSQLQVNQVMTNAAATLAGLNGMNAQRIADPQMLGYRVFPMEQPKSAPKPHANVVPLFRNPAPSRRFFPDFTPPSAA